ncbi:hypothetical protein JNO12_24095 [Erwinia aphidicola]|nr:hypothetical protein [Erwinia aphidicola]
MDNATVESFDGRLRQECMSEHELMPLGDTVQNRGPTQK